MRTPVVRADVALVAHTWHACVAHCKCTWKPAGQSSQRSTRLHTLMTPPSRSWVESSKLHLQICCVGFVHLGCVLLQQQSELGCSVCVAPPHVCGAVGVRAQKFGHPILITDRYHCVFVHHTFNAASRTQLSWCAGQSNSPHAQFVKFKCGGISCGRRDAT